MAPEEARRFDPALKDLSDEKLIDAIWLLDELAELVLMEYFRSTKSETGESREGEELS